MILERALMVAAAIAAIAAAAAVSIVALAFALYALLAPHLGQAGAAGAVALAFAVAVGLVGLIAANRAQPSKGAAVTKRDSLGLTERLMELVRDKPFAAAGVAVAIGLLAVRNPRMIGSILRAFLEGWQGSTKKR